MTTRDGNGNPSLERGNTGRIDILSATVLAVGLAAALPSGGFSISQDTVLTRIETAVVFTRFGGDGASRRGRAAIAGRRLAAASDVGPEGYTVAADAGAPQDTAKRWWRAKFGPLANCASLCRDSCHEGPTTTEGRAKSNESGDGYLAELRRTI